MIRKRMVECGWEDGHFLVHIHHNYGLAQVRASQTRHTPTHVKGKARSEHCSLFGNMVHSQQAAWCGHVFLTC